MEPRYDIRSSNKGGIFTEVSVVGSEIEVLWAEDVQKLLVFEYQWHFKMYGTFRWSFKDNA